MKKTNKQLIFERMGLGISSPKFTMQQEIKEDVSSDKLMNDLQSFWRENGRFPVQTPEGIGFIETDEEWDNFISAVLSADTSLPY